MYRKHTIVRTGVLLVWALLLAGLSGGGSLDGLLSVAHADPASAKRIVDAAKAQGVVGEQADGYLGFVRGSADGTLRGAVAEINAGRAAVYRSAAASAGVTPEAAAQAAAQQILARVPPGQYYRTPSGSWARK